MYFLILLGARSPKSVCWQGRFLLEVLRGNDFMFLSELLVAAGHPWPIVTLAWLSPCVPLSLPLCPIKSPLLSLIRTLVIGFRAHPKSRMISSEIFN